MNREDLWNLFAKTGKIEYYLKYKKYGNKKDLETKDDKENRRNYN